MFAFSVCSGMQACFGFIALCMLEEESILISLLVLDILFLF